MDDKVSSLRKEAGRKAAKKGEALHDTASPEFRDGYRYGALGFGSNVTPVKFGFGADRSSVWYCVCGYENKSNRVAKRGGEVVCWQCGVQQSYGEDHERDL